MYLCKHQVITIIKWSHLLPCGSTKVCHTNGGKELQYLLKRQYLSITRRETQKDSFVQYLYECTMSSVIVCMSTTLFCQDLSKEQWETWQFTQQVQRAKIIQKIIRMHCVQCNAILLNKGADWVCGCLCWKYNKGNAPCTEDTDAILVGGKRA